MAADDADDTQICADQIEEGAQMNADEGQICADQIEEWAQMTQMKRRFAQIGMIEFGLRGSAHSV